MIRTSALGGALVVACLAGCGSRPVTPVNAAQSGAAPQAPKPEPRPDRCNEATLTGQSEARGDHFRGAEAFDSFGCRGPQLGK